MGGKYQNLKLLMTVFMSVLALFIFYLASTQSLTNPNYIILGMGVLYIILGNYFKTIRPNYFLGIKTPWTLESETVWKKTHELAGKMWFIGGIVVVLASMALGKQSNLTVFLIITVIISVIPILYSYLQFKKESRKEGKKERRKEGKKERRKEGKKERRMVDGKA